MFDQVIALIFDGQITANFEYWRIDLKEEFIAIHLLVKIIS